MSGNSGRWPALVLCLAGGLAWGFGQATDAGDDPWQNVQVLEGASREDMDLFMRAISASLGVECAYCHEPEGWHLEGREEKRIARSMMRMVASLSETGFEALDLPSCWTCHRGSATPGTMPGPDVAPPPAYPAGAFSDSPAPAGEVYENIRQLGSLPARDLAGVMATYSRSLGVGCEHCHVPGDWASDERLAKLLARRMFEIQTETSQTFFESGREISCWTCHHGEAVPELSVPVRLMPEL